NNGRIKSRCGRQIEHPVSVSATFFIDLIEPLLEVRIRLFGIEIAADVEQTLAEEFPAFVRYRSTGPSFYSVTHLATEGFIVPVTVGYADNAETFWQWVTNGEIEQ